MKHKTPIQIRFKDIDALGHVNNANHLSYLEMARIHYFEAVVGKNINWSEDGIILAKVTIDYKMPMMLVDKVFVYTKCSRVGTKSFDLEYTIIKEEGGKEIILATAATVMVCFDYKTQTSIPIKEEWKKLMLDYEK